MQCSEEEGGVAAEDSEPYYVGKKDEHTGVGDAGGIPYTYKHVESPPTPTGAVYRVTAYLDYVDAPIHRNVYYVPSDRLDRFVRDHNHQIMQEIVDIRPTTYEKANASFAEYRGEGE